MTWHAKAILLSVGLLGLFPKAPAALQVEGSRAEAPLAEEIRALDRRLFDLVFVKEDPAALRALLADDFHFLHDRWGLVADSPEAFVAVVHRNFAPDSVRARREVIPGEEAVHPLAQHGAIHTGRHRFYGIAAEGPEILREIGRFFHVWRRGSKGWRLAQVYSYDHQPGPAAGK